MATRHVQVRFLNGKSACLELVPGEKVGDLKLGAPGAAVAHATEAAAARVAPFNRGVDKTIQQRGAASGRPGAPKRGGSGRGGHFAGLFQHQASRMLFFAQLWPRCRLAAGGGCLLLPQHPRARLPDVHLTGTGENPEIGQQNRHRSL